MDASAETFIERMGLQFEEDGLPRIAGRVMGLLLLKTKPASLEELATELQVSKASASTNCRLLEGAGLAERHAFPGDRRDYYGAHPDMALRSLDSARGRMESLVGILAEALRDLPSEMALARRRIQRLHDFHSFLLVELKEVTVRWAQREVEGTGGGPAAPAPEAGEASRSLKQDNQMGDGA
jgi:DNA-binding transcriptional regulator GbsR (MarR family)